MFRILLKVKCTVEPPLIGHLLSGKYPKFRKYCRIRILFFVCGHFNLLAFQSHLLYINWIYSSVYDCLSPKLHSAGERRIHTATCKSLSVAQQFLQFCKVNSLFPKVCEWVMARVSCLVFEENFAFFNSIHFTLFFLCCVFPFALLTNHITVIRRTLIASLLADFLLNNLTLKCCTKSSVSCDAANRTCVL